MGGEAHSQHQHVSCWQLFALGRPAIRAAWASPAASGGWDTTPLGALGLAVCGRGVGGERQSQARARLASGIRPTDKNDADNSLT